MHPYQRGRGWLFGLRVGGWKGIFQAKFEGTNDWMILFSNKDGLREFTQKEKYFLLETKKESIQRNMERDALHHILRKVTGDPCFTTEIMDLL